MALQRWVVSLLVAVLALAIVAQALPQQQSSACKTHVSCISSVLRASHICVGEMLCKQLCEDISSVVSAAVESPLIWDQRCGSFSDSARFVLRAEASQLASRLAVAAGCGEQACHARLRVGNVAAVCESDAFAHLIAETVCDHQRILDLEDEQEFPHSRFGREAEDVFANTPEGSLPQVSPTAPTTLVIGDGRKAGDIIGFIVLCALLIACIIPLTILCLRSTFLYIKNFDSQAFMSRFSRGR